MVQYVPRVIARTISLKAKLYRVHHLFVGHVFLNDSGIVPFITVFNLSSFSTSPKCMSGFDFNTIIRLSGYLLLLYISHH